MQQVIVNSLFQQIGKAFLPPIVISKSLPAPTEVKQPGPSSAEATSSAPPKVEAAPQVNSEANSTPAAPEVNSVPKAQVQEESLPVLSTPLSPYPNVS